MDEAEEELMTPQSSIKTGCKDIQYESPYFSGVDAKDHYELRAMNQNAIVSTKNKFQKQEQQLQFEFQSTGLQNQGSHIDHQDHSSPSGKIFQDVDRPSSQNPLSEFYRTPLIFPDDDVTSIYSFKSFNNFVDPEIGHRLQQNNFGTKRPYESSADFSDEQISKLAIELSQRFVDMKKDSSVDTARATQIFEQVITQFGREQNICDDSTQQIQRNPSRPKFEFLKKEKLLNNWEKKMDLNFQPFDLMIYMDQQISQGVETPSEMWELKEESQPNCKIWASWNGSEINQDLPQMKTEHYFLNVNDPQIILKAIIQDRCQWDTGLDQFEEIEEFTSEFTSVHRVLMKSILNLSQREFIDKKLIFTRKQAIDFGGNQNQQNDSQYPSIESADNLDDIFMWVTSAPDDLYPMSTKFVRSDSLVGIIRIGRIATWPKAMQHLQKYDVDISQGGCYMHYISQTDIKIGNWTQKLLIPIIPKNLMTWGQSLREHLQNEKEVEVQQW